MVNSYRGAGPPSVAPARCAGQQLAPSLDLRLFLFFSYVTPVSPFLSSYLLIGETLPKLLRTREKCLGIRHILGTIATLQSGGCQLLLQLSLHLEGMAKNFRSTNQDVSSGMIILSGRMVHYFPYQWWWDHVKWLYETGNRAKREHVREVLLYCVLFRMVFAIAWELCSTC